jgi:putative transcriptional regulator
MAKKIKVNIFDDMKHALQHAAAYERGEPVNLRVTRIPSRPKPISAKEVRHIRQALNASQALFATYLNVSPNTVRSWEQGTRRPRQAAIKLLAIAKKNPKALLVAQLDAPPTGHFERSGPTLFPSSPSKPVQRHQHRPSNPDFALGGGSLVASFHLDTKTLDIGGNLIAQG